MTGSGPVGVGGGVVGVVGDGLAAGGLAAGGLAGAFCSCPVQAVRPSIATRASARALRLLDRRHRPGDEYPAFERLTSSPLQSPELA